ncbi:hypothetical protein GCM10023224_40430 [Streptomonospora halophila]|uniref:Uncharacterized protein n=1 Tax=Streptomonospora halophila TaxID=427369 RepID=A0ABP9GSV1_9ACTN
MRTRTVKVPPGRLPDAVWRTALAAASDSSNAAMAAVDSGTGGSVARERRPSSQWRASATPVRSPGNVRERERTRVPVRGRTRVRALSAAFIAHLPRTA